MVYGEPFLPFLEPILRDIGRWAAAGHRSVLALPVEEASRRPARCARVERLYVLPFDLPKREAGPPPAFLRRLFPRAQFLNPPETHELCWDKLAAERRLLARGVPVPETIFTESPEELREFVAQHAFVILKERQSCGGQGHVVLCDSDQVLVGEANGRRFAVELRADSNARRRLEHGVLTCPPPYYAQRLVGTAGPGGAFMPGQVLRAYVVEGRIAFWTERFRDRYRRPSDWIVNACLGAKYRFVLETSEETRKVALRAAECLGIRIGVVDLVRTAATGPYVLEADTDGYHMYIDRTFKRIPEYRDAFDFDRMIAEALLAPEAAARR